MKLCPQCDTGYPDSAATCPTHGGMLSEIRDLRPGMLIRNTYRIVRKLGQGGMGAVYLSQHTLMEEPRALKFLSHDLSSDQAFAARFLREVRTLRQIRNSNVVDCGDLERAEDDSLFFPMEFVDGPDLRRFLRNAPRPFDVQLALSIARGIAEGLGAAHAKGMVHRDIKPENILMALVGDRWVPKIADFGIVATKENSSIYTRTGGTLLTMPYAAPEQWRGLRAAELDGRTDLYAFGGVLFEMLTGGTVFSAENYEGWAEQHKYVAPRAPSSIRPDLANWQGLDALVLRLLVKDRDRRPRDVAEVLHMLDGVHYSPQSLNAANAWQETAAIEMPAQDPTQQPGNGAAIQSPHAGAELPGEKAPQANGESASALGDSHGGSHSSLGGNSGVPHSPPNVPQGKTRQGSRKVPGWVWLAALILPLLLLFALWQFRKPQPATPSQTIPTATQPAPQATNVDSTLLPASAPIQPTSTPLPPQPLRKPETSSPASGGTLPKLQAPSTTNRAGTVPQPQAQPVPKRVSIAPGVAAGMLIVKTEPQYPALAIAAHISGTVVLQEIIDRQGSVKELKVLSGPAILGNAALDAVSNWRYRPFLINKQPVEVETTVNVNFVLDK